MIKLIYQKLTKLRKGHSTTLALLKFVKNTLTSFDKGNAVYAFLIDLSKAFDCLDRKTSFQQVRILWNKRKNA